MQAAAAAAAAYVCKRFVTRVYSFLAVQQQPPPAAGPPASCGRTSHQSSSVSLEPLAPGESTPDSTEAGASNLDVWRASIKALVEIHTVDIEWSELLGVSSPRRQAMEVLGPVSQPSDHGRKTEH